MTQEGYNRQLRSCREYRPLHNYSRQPKVLSTGAPSSVSPSNDRTGNPLVAPRVAAGIYREVSPLNALHKQMLLLLWALRVAFSRADVFEHTRNPVHSSK